MLDAKRTHPMTTDRADPGKGRRMAIQHRHITQWVGTLAITCSICERA
jgi:hypothetical protein